MTRNPIAATVDLSAPGRNLGYLRLPHSVHRSAYGVIPIPIASVVGEGDGPTVFVMGGNHGDEYEGQIIVSELIRTLDPKHVTGKILLMPMANHPAAEAGRRVSPIDEGNLNRSFPGDPLGRPTAMIADYIESVLMPGCDLFLDLHSGGSSFHCLPFAMTPWPADDPRADMRRAVLDAAGLGYAVLYSPTEETWFSTSAAWRHGAVGFTFELGGGGTVDTAIRAGAQAGVLRALKAVGAYTGPTSDLALAKTRRDFMKDGLIFADEPGLFEPLVVSGAEISAGQVVGLIHAPETPGKAPLDVVAERDAFVLAHRIPARVIRGDAVFHLGLWDML
jgi:predicted deacylase